LGSSMESQRFDPAMPFSVIIFGATGDLARKKLFPALYQARSLRSLRHCATVRCSLHC
jgi:glucose-6-phosphate 1-dehydrogenase